MILALVLLPALAGIVSFFMRKAYAVRALMISTAFVHLCLVARCWHTKPAPFYQGWFALDSLGLLFLSIASFLFFFSTIYRVGSGNAGTLVKKRDFEGPSTFIDFSESVYCACMLLFLSTMTLVCVSLQFGMIWVGVEATTLASAPLIYYHRHKRSLEAAWKYLLICSVGIVIALLGNFFLAVAVSEGDLHSSLVLSSLMNRASLGHIDIFWLKGAFLLLIVGYGTKMGLAPMHTWLPDAHSESPSAVSALLSGALLNCSFLGIIRAQQLLNAAGAGKFGSELLIMFGIFSMAVAAIFILGQSDYKRMLAYSSVEHMGILAIGVGVGGMAVYGSMLHAVNHSLTKAALFFTAGNILTFYKSKSFLDVRGALKFLPVSGAIWVAGFFAITGSPPFGTFFSEFSILKGIIDQERTFIAAAYLALLAVVFVGMVGRFFKMAYGNMDQLPAERVNREPVLSFLPPVVMILAVFILGLCIPDALTSLLLEAADELGGLR